MVFSSVYVIDATCFDECFLFHVIAGRRYFFSKLDVTVRFFQPAYCRFLWNKCFERSPYFTYLHNNSVVLILMLNSKKSYPILYLYILEKLPYVAAFFMITFFTIFNFLTVPHFLYKTFSFSEKLKAYLKACFYIILRNFHKWLFYL